MYIPGKFKIEETAVLHGLIRDYSFALVFSSDNGKGVATHLPLMLDSSRGKYGTLIGHLARANPHWKSWDENTELLVVFQGPHTYISPSMYSDQRTVPTWNYAAVHAYGFPELVHDAVPLRRMVDELVDHHESLSATPWSYDDLEDDINGMLPAIVGFEIEITRLEGKFKLNQNKKPEDRKKVIEILAASESEMDRKVAEMMRLQEE